MKVTTLNLKKKWIFNLKFFRLNKKNKYILLYLRFLENYDNYYFFFFFKRTISLILSFNNILKKYFDFNIAYFINNLTELASLSFLKKYLFDVYFDYILKKNMEIEKNFSFISFFYQKKKMYTIKKIEKIEKIQKIQKIHKKVKNSYSENYLIMMIKRYCAKKNLYIHLKNLFSINMNVLKNWIDFVNLNEYSKQSIKICFNFFKEIIYIYKNIYMIDINSIDTNIIINIKKNIYIYCKLFIKKYFFENGLQYIFFQKYYYYDIKYNLLIFLLY